MQKLTLCFLLSLFCISTSWSTPITFQYNSTSNTNVIGTPVQVTFTFDSNLANGTGDFSTSPNNASYGAWTGNLHLGNKVMTVNGGTIDVWNGLGNRDGYTFGWDSKTQGKCLSGCFLQSFNISIIDNAHAMFSSIKLPTTPNFILKGSWIADTYVINDNLTYGLFDTPPVTRTFTLTAVPLPNAIGLFALGLLGLLRVKRNNT